MTRYQLWLVDDARQSSHLYADNMSEEYMRATLRNARQDLAGYRMVAIPMPTTPALPEDY